MKQPQQRATRDMETGESATEEQKAAETQQVAIMDGGDGYTRERPPPGPDSKTAATSDSAPSLSASTLARRPMSEAPMDGRTLYLFGADPDAKGVAAAYRRTRQYNRDATRWEVKTLWMQAFGSRPIDFEPQAWTDLPEGWAG